MVTCFSCFTVLWSHYYIRYIRGRATAEGAGGGGGGGGAAVPLGGGGGGADAASVVTALSSTSGSSGKVLASKPKTEGAIEGPVSAPYVMSSATSEHKYWLSKNSKQKYLKLNKF